MSIFMKCATKPVGICRNSGLIRENVI